MEDQNNNNLFKGNNVLISIMAFFLHLQKELHQFSYAYNDYNQFATTYSLSIKEQVQLLANPICD